MSQILEHISQYSLLKERYDHLGKRLSNAASPTISNDDLDALKKSANTNKIFNDFENILLDSNGNLKKEYKEIGLKLKDITALILKDLCHLMICHITLSYSSLVKYTYYFAVSESEMVTIDFNFELKKNIDNETFLTVKGVFGERFDYGISFCSNVLSKQNNEDNSSILMVSDIKNTSLPTFLDNCSNRFLTNITEIIKSSRRPELANQPDKVLSLKNHFEFLHDKLSNVLADKDETEANIKLRPFNVTESKVSKIIKYSIEKEKEHLFYALNNSLTNEKDKSKVTKI